MINQIIAAVDNALRHDEVKRVFISCGSRSLLAVPANGFNGLFETTKKEETYGRMVEETHLYSSNHTSCCYLPTKIRKFFQEEGEFQFELELAE